MEVVDGKIYITLGFGQTDLMSNIRVVVNGTTVNYTVVNSSSSNNTKDIKFQVPSIDSAVTVKAYISALGRDISFGVSFLESTLEMINQSQVNKPLGQTTDSSFLNNISTTTTEEEEIADEIQAKNSYKKYTIENEVLSNSETGLSMARKYTDQISILEEVDGELYLTVGFSGTDLIGNIKVSINGEMVEHSVVSNDDTTKRKSIRFPITNVSDDMRVYMYINPVQMNIDYGLKLKEETMTLVEDVLVEENQEEEIVELETSTTESKNNNDVDVFKIALTSSLATALVIFSVGGVTYVVIKRKNKQNKEN